MTHSGDDEKHIWRIRGKEDGSNRTVALGELWLGGYR